MLGTTCVNFSSNPLVVEKMGFIAKKQERCHKIQFLYNHFKYSTKSIEYIVNGKSAIKWVIERYAVTTHKESGIMNNHND